jgi:hypothetical protein
MLGIALFAKVLMRLLSRAFPLQPIKATIKTIAPTNRNAVIIRVCKDMFLGISCSMISFYLLMSNFLDSA